MDIAIAPVAGTPSVQAVAGQPAPVLTPGEIVDAKVLQILKDGMARLVVADTMMDVATQAQLIPGATVRLAVTASDSGLKLVIVDQAPPPGAPQTSASGQQTAAPSGSPAAPLPSADPAVVQHVANLPPGVPAAPAGAAGPAAGAAAGPAVSTPPSTQGLSSPPPQSLPLPQPSPAAAAAAVLTQAVQTAAARQTGLSPVFANAEVAAHLASLPEPVRRAAQQLLALRPALDQTVSPDTIKQAFQRSGLFMEARLAAAATDGAEPAALPSNDLKAALTVLRAVLGSWLDDDGAKALPHMPAAVVPTTEPRTSPPAPAQAAPSAPPPPPYRGAPLAAQPMLSPSIVPDATPDDAGRALIADVDGALSRQTLLQAASLPDAADAAPLQDGPRWNFEVPFALPQGTTVAQFEIARDGRGNSALSLEPVWRVRFSVDLEPIGPVHAQVALIGARAAVTLWAERPETSARLRENSSSLSEALSGEFEASDVTIRDGAPPRPRDLAPSGRFLDRAS